MTRVQEYAIRSFIHFLDTEVLDLIHENISDYIKMYPEGSLKAPRILEIVEEISQMRYELKNDL